MSASTNQGLVVPLNILAFAVNQKDAHDATPYFSGASTVFTDQTGPNQAFLGANVNRSLMGSPAQPLEAGIHLHWALPDALTKANTDDTGNLVFMPTPNRWLVQRLVLDTTQNNLEISRNAWVVLSDLLNNNLPVGQTSITLPTYPSSNNQNYQYSGEYQLFSQNWAEPIIPDAQSFKNMTGLELSAVANGQAVFSSFYPNCRGVFGFLDNLTDLTLPPNSSVEIMYVVTGWYSNLANDPLNGGLNLAQIQEAYAWTFQDSEQAANPSYSLYQGFVQSVIWHPDETYLPNYSLGLQTIDLDISLGNNPSETMAAYLQQQLKPDLPYFQTLMSGYFQGLLGKLQVPAPNQLADLEENLHETQFQAIKAEYIYVVMQKNITFDTENQPVVNYVQADDLAPQLGDSLNLLNFYAQSVQGLQESLENFQWQLFADWYRIFMVVASQQQQSYNIAYQKYNAYATQTQQLTNAQTLLTQQLALVNSQLASDQELQQVPAPRFWQGNDPVLMLSGQALPPSNRYGDNGQYNARGNLVCRLDANFISAVQIGQSTFNATNFTQQLLPTPNNLPASQTFNNLLVESLLLNATVLSKLSQTIITYSQVQAAIQGNTSPLTLTGTPPSLIALTQWQNNPWVPLFAYWDVEFQPIFATTDNTNTQIINYAPDFFTTQFTIDQNDGGQISYQASSDPSSYAFNQSYQGVSVLTTSAINGFINQLSGSQVPILQQSLQCIEAQNMVMQSLSGLNNEFIMHSQELQLNIQVPQNSEYYPLTQAIAAAVGGYKSSAPNFNSFYNPIRAGFLKISATLIDIFGQKKTINPSAFILSQDLQTQYQGEVISNIAYLPPRISQATRLLFRFLAADTTNYEEMNAHPATTPICGWLLPNHLSNSLFIYDTQGASIGTLFLNGDNTKIMWQSAPGDNDTIDQDVATAMHDQQPQLRDLVIALSEETPSQFLAFMQAIDNVNGFVEPQEYSSNNDLAILIGRPMAIVQAALTLEIKGTPNYNQSWSVLGLDPTKNPLCETDNDFTKVQFPVILGDLANLNDGLIGYYKYGQNNYDWDNFYTFGTSNTNPTGVQQPTQNTLSLTPSPKSGQTQIDTASIQKILMLIDPRAMVHATMGILPTKGIRIPPNMYTDTLRTLEMTFLTTPVLAGSSAFNLPLPNETGYEWSWVQEKIISDTPVWQTTPGINATPPNGVWTYTPQTIREGWLRLNPQLLDFEIFNSNQKAILTQGINNNLTLNLTNEQGRSIGFTPSNLVPESGQKTGSIFYIHFGTAVPQDQVANIQLSASNWQFECVSDQQYGSYWAASPTQNTTLDADSILTIEINNLTITTTKQQIMVFFDYYNVENLNDGVYQDVISIAAN